MPTPPSTDNHGLPLIPAFGETNAADYEDIWGTMLNDDAWSVLDEKLIVRDTVANTGNYTPYAGAFYWATDGNQPIYEGDGTSWVKTDAEFSDIVASTVTATTLSADNASVSNAPSSSTDVVRQADLHTRYSDEEAQDAVGGILNTDFTYDDTNNVVSLAANSVTVAGQTVSLGGSTNVPHNGLTSISEDQHHAKSHDHSEVDITTVPNAGLTNSSVTVAGNAISLGGSSTISHADLSSVGTDDHHAENHDHSEAGISAVGNQGLANYRVTVAGNTVALGATTSVAHADLSSIGAGDHHIAHEHPGDQVASSAIDAGGNNVTNVSTLSGQYASHGFDGTTYNIDLKDSTVDARYRNTSGTTIAWFRESADFEVPNGQISEQGNRVATRTWSTSNFVDVSGDTMSGTLGMGGNDIHNTRQIDGSTGNHRIRFDSNNSWIEITDQSNNRNDLVTNDIYANGSWFSDHETNNSAHHTKYSNEEAQDAVGGILNTDFNYDDTNNVISLASNSVSVAGNSVALGGSTGIALGDLSNVTASGEGSGNGFDSDTIDGYDIQKNGTDGTGIINFKT